ncbi:MAG TPA: nucleotidyltransferase domain-containing protein [Candidatus Nanoarchaeia archaeon]|nr:nucleotidyltransferase domain-containing protein [Candidatus Nanoarchaeia archaeon]
MKKEENLLKLFFNQPLKPWHFEEILKTGKISRPQASLWLKKFLQEQLIKKIHPKNKKPYYVADYESPNYQNCKRILALQKLHQSGLLNVLVSLKEAECIILFGSFSRWDWYEQSDIDLFIYGKIPPLNFRKFESIVHHEIQIFNAGTEKDLQKLGPALLRNIIKGITIKGDIPLEVIKHAVI